MNDLLELMVEQGASDLHLQVGQPPTLRVSGSMMPIDGPPLTPADTEKLMLSITPDGHVSNVKLNGGADFGFAFGEKARFRVSVLKAKTHYGMVLRQIPFKMFSLRDIGLPDKIRELLYRPRGLILVTGPTGSGKSTTLASMVNYINEARDGHVITIEDPIEYEHHNGESVIEQIEVGRDAPSFAAALRAALRQDPDVILVGEMRDLDTVATALTAAETGHLILSTLHTRDAVQAISRMVDVFPPAQQTQIKTQLAMSLNAIISQQLMTRADGKGRVVAVEVLLANLPVRNHIRNDKLQNLATEITLGKRHGMITMEDSLVRLVRQGLIALDDARMRSSRPEELESLLR
jgi:twitching motility protein PilT